MSKKDKTSRGAPVALESPENLKDPAKRKAFVNKLADSFVEAVQADRKKRGLPPLTD